MINTRNLLCAGVSGWLVLLMLSGCAGQPTPDVVEKRVEPEGYVAPVAGRQDAGRFPSSQRTPMPIGDDGSQGGAMSGKISWGDGKTETSGKIVTEDGEVYQFQSEDSPQRTDEQTRFEQSINQQIDEAFKPTSEDAPCYTITETVDAQAGERVVQCATGRTITMISRQDVESNTYWEIKDPDMRMIFKQKQFATIEGAANILCGCPE